MEKYENISDYAVIYHWWDDTNTNLADSLVPIIPSIASLRAVSDISIYVLDISKKKRNWSKYSKALNFEVVPFISKFDTVNYGLDPRDISKPFDLDKFSKCINSKVIVSCDSDVFWIKNPFPVEKDCNKFCCNTNTGYFYCKKEHEWIDLWKFYTLEALQSEENLIRIKKNVMNYYNKSIIKNFLNTEIIHQYILLDLKRIELNANLSYKEHLTPYNPIPKEFNMIHFCNFIIHKRHLFPFIIEEIYNNIVKLLPEYKKYRVLKKISIKNLNFEDLVGNLLTEKKVWTSRYF